MSAGNDPQAGPAMADAQAAAGEALRPVAVLVGALGGEGGGVLAQWLVEAASEAGLPAQATSIPGVAQRTGSTTYYVEIFPRRRDALGGREPVMSLYPVPGQVDVVVASELLEAGRIAASGMVSAGRTTLIASTSRTLTTAEKMAIGDGRADAVAIEAVLRAHSRDAALFDMAAAGREAGTLVSAVMFGALAGSGRLPLSRAQCESVVRAGGRGAEASLRGFACGHDATIAALAAGAGTSTSTSTSTSTHGTPGTGAAMDHAPSALTAERVVSLGEARTRDFQDDAYAALYRARVGRIAAAERAADPARGQGGAMLREYARFLALWMAFDDVVRVAGQKVSAARFARVRSEVGASDGDVLRIVDHFKPGVPELAGLLPRALAGRIERWDARRQARGRPPLAFALKLRSDSVAGFALLRVLAGARGLRRRGRRYADEQAMIERWTDAVEQGARAGWAVGHEVALCGRLVKGYGETNARGKRNLVHILGELVERRTLAPAAPAQQAAAIRRAREAALADEGGVALDQALVAAGAAARPVIAQPVRWVRRPPAREARR